MSMRALAAAMLICGFAATNIHARVQESGAADAERGEGTPLFADDSPLDIVLDGPIQRIVARKERSTEPYPATLEAAGETHAITLAARGVSRRLGENCSFPPLRIELTEKASASSLFHKQRRIKLVTHCDNLNRNESAVLREYATYRLYHRIAPEALRVRLVQVTYRNDGDRMGSHVGFLIEDGDDAARRSGLKEVDTGSIPRGALAPRPTARYLLFQYMIGNTDFAMTGGVDPDDCCHNSRLFGAAKNAQTDLIPVPYDFDNAGVVNAPYAVPNASLSIRTVRTRLYRGPCTFNDAVRTEAVSARGWQPLIEDELASLGPLPESSRKAMIDYIQPFFEIVADPDKVESRLLKRCRD